MGWPLCFQTVGVFLGGVGGSCCVAVTSQILFGIAGADEAHVLPSTTFEGVVDEQKQWRATKHGPEDRHQ